MKVVFCASEVFPFVKTGGLADVCGALPLALSKIGVKVSVILPHYGVIDDKKFKIKKLDRKCSLTKIGTNIDVYLIDHKKYFFRKGLYGGRNGDHKDNLDRFSYFCRQSLKVIKERIGKVDIIHCHDWQTALIPVYVKELYGQDPDFKSVKTLLTIHNLAFQGLFKMKEAPRLKLSGAKFKKKKFEFYGKLNLLKGGIAYSDQINTVSRQYSKEILSREYGCGLEKSLRNRTKNIHGIINGIDQSIWDPKKDGFIKCTYGLSGRNRGKEGNKKSLQRRVGLPLEKKLPLLSFVGRLSHQKGVDLMIETINDLIAFKCQIVLLGQGDPAHTKKLKILERQNRRVLKVFLEFDEKLAHQIYAGSDIFLMPSRFEPCGLSQMISLMYGTIPIVFKTGGLADTVKAFSSKTKKGNGFVFSKYSKDAFLKAVKGGVECFDNKGSLRQIAANAMKNDFSWKRSAERYKRLYQCM